MTMFNSFAAVAACLLLGTAAAYTAYSECDRFAAACDVARPGGLNGTLSGVDMTKLSALQILVLNENEIRGPVPPSLESLSKLIQLDCFADLYKRNYFAPGSLRLLVALSTLSQRGIVECCRV